MSPSKLSGYGLNSVSLSSTHVTVRYSYTVNPSYPVSKLHRIAKAAPEGMSGLVAFVFGQYR
jgi:hypothetical protein